MRVIGQINHPVLKITVFKMDNRLSVKFENALYEQTYKFGLDGRVDTLAAVEQLVDAAFIDGVQQQMQAMHHNRLTALAKHFPIAEEQPFEEII